MNADVSLSNLSLISLSRSKVKHRDITQNVYAKWKQQSWASECEFDSFDDVLSSSYLSHQSCLQFSSLAKS